MFRKLTIEHFKLFRRLEVDGLGPFTIVSGRNSVGKTALLEAAFLMFDRANPDQIFRQYRWRGIPKLVASTDAAWLPVFRNYDATHPIVIQISNSEHRHELTVRLLRDHQPRQVEATAPQAPPVIDLATLPAARDAMEFQYRLDGSDAGLTFLRLNLPSGVVLEVDHLVGPQLKVGYQSSRNRADAADDATMFGELDRIGATSELLPPLRLIEPRLKDLSIIPIGDMPVLHGSIGLRAKVPVALLGDGVARALSILLTAHRVAGGLLLIDEIENGFHHSVQTKVLGAIAAAAHRWNTQVIATTHSYELLQNAVDSFLDAKDDFAFARLELIDGEVTATVADYDSFASAIGAELELR